MHQPFRHKRPAATVATAVILVLAAACSSSSSDGNTTGSGSTAPGTAATVQSDNSATGTDTAATVQTDDTAASDTDVTIPSQVVKVDLADFTIGIPPTIQAGPVRFEASNTGTEEHQMSIIRLKDGQTSGDLLGSLAADPAKGLAEADLYPGPQAVAPGGAPQSIDVNLPAGKYVGLCFIPSPDGTPHAAKGMVKEFEVTGPDSDAAIAPATGGVDLYDYRFEVAKDFTGQGVVGVANKGSKTHELAIYEVKDGKTYDEAKAYLTAKTPPPGESPVTPDGGVTALAPNRDAGMVLDLQPGTYVFICFLPLDNGMPHFTEGMVKEVTVK